MAGQQLPLLDADGEIENIVTVALESASASARTGMRKAKDAAEAALRNFRETQNSADRGGKTCPLGRLVAGVAHEVTIPSASA